MTFTQFTRSEYRQHQHASTHPYLLWVAKYIDELVDAFKAYTEGTF